MNLEELPADMISLKVDYAFKRILKNDKILKGFLNAVLQIKPEDITELQIEDPALDKERPADKQGIMDIRLTMKGKARINIELQIKPYKNWDNRSMFYNFKMFMEQFQKGKMYSLPEKCIHISILDFDFIKGEKDFYSLYKIMNVKSHQIYSDNIEFHVINLKKLKRATHEEQKTALYAWARLFAAESWEDYHMIQTEYSEEAILAAIDELDRMNQDDGSREAYWRQRMALMDQLAIQEGCKEQGHQEGLEEGLQEGREQGLKEGLKEGLQQGGMLKTIEFVKRLVLKGCDEKEVSELLNEKIELVEKILRLIEAEPDAELQKIYEQLMEMQNM